ncbi:hypothetical protein HAX54_038244, partial [Datura stramonium]|nr:hypothetical protein [Datura stramonium]
CNAGEELSFKFTARLLRCTALDQSCSSPPKSQLERDPRALIALWCIDQDPLRILKEVKLGSLDFDVEITKSQALIDLLGSLDQETEEYDSALYEELPNDRPSSDSSSDNGYG